jgi:hypothetical protein
MKMDAPLTNIPMGPPIRIPAATIPKEAINPIIVAKSIDLISNVLITNKFL